MIWSAGCIGAAVVTMLAASPIASAATTELITNGGFDDGGLAGWSVDTLFGSTGGQTFYVNPHGSNSPQTNFSVKDGYTIDDGNYAISDTPRHGHGAAALSQDFTVPDDYISATLSYDMFVNSIAPPYDDTFGFYSSDPSAQYARVDLLSPGFDRFDTQSDVQRNFYRGTDGASPPYAPTHYSFDVTPNLTAGQAYRLRFAEINNRSTLLNQGVDNVSLVATYATDSVWDPSVTYGYWSEGSNWSTSNPPDATTNALIAIPGSSIPAITFRPNTVVGTSTSATARNLTLGYDIDSDPDTIEHGTLEILGQLRVDRDVNLGRDAGTGGVVDLSRGAPSSSQLNVGGSIYVGGSAAGANGSVPYRNILIVGTGDVNVTGDVVVYEPYFAQFNRVTIAGGTLSASTLDLRHYSLVDGYGTIDADVSVGAAFIEPDGTLTVAGDLTLSPEGSVFLYLFSNGLSDTLDILGNAQLDTDEFGDGGLVSVVLDDDYDPAAGDRFDILNFASVSGDATWSDIVSLYALPSGLSWDTSELDTSGIITVVPEPASLALLALGVGWTATRRRRRRA